LLNRRYLGLVFAVGMGWQLVFIGWIAMNDFPYFVRTFVNLANLIAGVVPYLFLIAMCLTSFRRYARHLSARNWRLLHKSGMYVLWLTITITYVLYLLYGVRGPNEFRSFFAVLFLSAWMLRIAAWVQKRRRRRSRDNQSLVKARYPATTTES
jgi:DMSO/TMAO reductase YedYZ heme-binding membrane subunit